MLKYVTYQHNPIEPHSWPVAECYRWDNEEPILSGWQPYPVPPWPVLRPCRKTARKASIRFKWYDLTAKRAMDRVLCETPETMDGVLGTASRFGFLGYASHWHTNDEFSFPLDGGNHVDERSRPIDSRIEGTWRIDRRGRTTGLYRDAAEGEPFEYWRYHISRLKTLASVRAMIDSRDVNGLRELAASRPSFGPDYDYHLANLREPFEWYVFHQWSKHPPSTPAPAPDGYSWVVVEDHAGRTSLQLSPFAWGWEAALPSVPDSRDDAYLEICIRQFEWAVTQTLLLHAPHFLRYRYDPRDKGIRTMPRTLLGAAYLDFVYELSGQRMPLRRCAGCGEWFEQEHGRQMVCSPRCRKRLSRLKQGNANG